MPRPRVLSLSFFGKHNTDSPSSPSSPTSANSTHKRKPTLDTFSAAALASNGDEVRSGSPSPSAALQNRNRSESRTSRVPSAALALQAVTMDQSSDTIPELQPIFSFINSHSNKLYHEGYFLKLHDLDSRGRPSVERTWTECFAQLVGTVLSLWDAAALDAAGGAGEVLPTFINLSDATIKMIESLPMNTSRGGTLQNVLSISTAASNRYLLHFNSLNSLTQWTSAIRLSMYEHATLQEAYTGSLIAGKGKMLNNIKVIMEKLRFKHEDWARVRFGAGTPWRRVWCVISPPDEKELAKAQKELKKRNNYDRKVTIPKGDIKFYDTRRVTKKTQPIATISDAFAAYAIYPQSKPLVDQSTLVKLEGLITIHAKPDTTTEGFLFVMPEVHPAVTGFEMMLRWLFPVWDTFGLYGRPNRLIADTLDQRGLMFAMPRDRRWGYLDILDVSGLIHTEGSQAWNERQWRTELKKLTSHRMNAMDSDSSPVRPRRNTTQRNSLPGVNRGLVTFDPDRASSHASQSSPSSRKQSPAPPGYDDLNMQPQRRAAPMNGAGNPSHRRSVSEAVNQRRFQADVPSRLSIDSTREFDEPPRPPAHGLPMNGRSASGNLESHSEEELPVKNFEELNIQTEQIPVTPVSIPPAFMHNPSSKPAAQPNMAPELRRATSGMDAATLMQMQDAVQRPEDQMPMPTNGHMHHNGAHPNQVAMVGQPRALPMIPTPLEEIQNPIATTDNSHQAHRTGTSNIAESDDMAQAMIDDRALEELLQNDGTSTMKSSIPDYDSVQDTSSRALPSLPDEDRPRTGRLKTVGDVTLASEPSGHQRSRSKFGPLHEEQEGAMPTINFGPTHSHDPAFRPSTAPQGAVALPSPSHNRAQSADDRGSYFSGRSTPNMIARKPVTPGGSPSPSRTQRRSMVWQPGVSPAEQSPRQALSPEQWVQQRASLASQPMARKSVPNLGVDHNRGLSKQLSTPNIATQNEVRSFGERARPLPTTPPTSGSRPGSRGAGAYLQTTESPALVHHRRGSSLSAQEQMHVARSTGSPLVDLQRSDRPTSQAGLYGALSALDQERMGQRGGLQSIAAQQAIAAQQQRQAQAMQAGLQYQAQMQQAAQAANYQAQMQQQQMQMQMQARQGPSVPPHDPRQQQRSSQYGAYPASTFSRPGPR